MAFKSEVELKVLDFDNYNTKDGRAVEQVVLGDLERCQRYIFRIPRGMPKPKIGDMVTITIDIKQYQGRQYPALSKIE